ncbi:hypothetical protein HanXRQr2_Chr16g0769241 [Helianthus annuus]|uniref:Uncharacterized protein n=2 Tax=Helianthus annuus TaxID=4232 RepID=A0A9K3DW27_HELAN|nr:hypothetical protein HanXRQr2_Chr16g0769241 [Helianthus annuus]
MPPGPQKRKPVKKKKKKKAKRSISSSASHLRLGESHSDLHNYPHSGVKVDSMDDSSSGYESLTTDITRKAAEQKQAKIQMPILTKQTKMELDEAAMTEPASVADYISRPVESSPEKGTRKDEDVGFKTPLADNLSRPVGFSPDKGTRKDEDLAFKTPVADNLSRPVGFSPDKGTRKDEDLGFKTPVADYLSQPFESSPEKGTRKVEDSGFKTPPTGDPVTPVDQSFVEVAAQLNNNSKIQEKDDLVVAETPLEQTVINETDPANNQLSKEIEVQKSGLKTPKSEENLLQDSMNGKCQYYRSSDDRVNEPVTPERYERQPLLASAPPPPEKASWKNCCGIFELFSGSTRN